MRRSNYFVVSSLVVAALCTTACSTHHNAPPPKEESAKSHSDSTPGPSGPKAGTVATTTIVNPSAPKEDNVSPAASPASPATFDALKTTMLDGKPANLADYKGKVLLVVNTASQCGLTPQYAGLEKLHEELQAKNFSVLGFPSNDFGGQEPGTPEEIKEFCTTKYSVTFPLFGKLQTKAGEGQSPVYAWLSAHSNGQLPRWNFGKYLIGKDGQVVAYFDSKVPPEDPALRKAIDTALAK